MTANADMPAGDGERRHDPLCPISSGPCCPWMGDCDCQCECSLIACVREDERAAALRDAIAAVESCEDGDYFPWPQVLIATAAITDLQP